MEIEGGKSMLENVLWLPILFVIHDFEELIFVPRWVRKNSDILAKKKKPLFGATTNSSALSVGVLEELIILLIISVTSVSNPNNVLYFSTLVGYTIHLFAHIIFCFQYTSYVPGIITSIIQLPFLILWIKQMYTVIDSTGIVTLFTCIVVLILLGVNVSILHRLMNWLSKKNIL